MRRFLLAAVLASGLGYAQGAEETRAEWVFENDGDALGWGGANHMTDVRVADGALQGRVLDWDPFLRSPEFRIAAGSRQRVEIRMRSELGGDGEIYWTGTTEGPHGGFAPEKRTSFRILGDGRWHDYAIHPFWHREGEIILMRIDFPRPADADKGKKHVAIASVRIVDPGEGPELGTAPEFAFTGDARGWRAQAGTELSVGAEGLVLRADDGVVPEAMSGPVRFSADDGFWAYVEIAAEVGSAASLHWASSETEGYAGSEFEIVADGRVHGYNVDLGSASGWDGEILLTGIRPTNVPGGRAVVRSLTFSDRPRGPAQPTITFAGLEDAMNRAGRDVPFLVSLSNPGGATARGLTIADLELPPGVAAVPGSVTRIADVEPFDRIRHRLFLRPERPVSGRGRIVVTGADGVRAEAAFDIRIDADLGLPRADYVPEPRPVETDYDIGAFYFPGWATIDRWARIWPTAPERKPVLGWYDESSPEVADWQIKWAVENGIRFFLLDWYWHQGSRSHEHWLHEAYGKARYRQYLKWAIMWANHNPAGSHSEEDQRAVTRYWIDTCFNMPEYYRIDDMPAVMIWSPANMERDMAGKGGAKRLLDISREMAREAGYKGIYFIAMKWPEADTSAGAVAPLKEQGFDMTSLYHYMHHGDRAANPRNFPFELVSDSSAPWWRARHETGILPFLPNLSTGWDSRPWHGAKSTVIHGRTPELFRKICEDAKTFADETGVRRLVLAPLNEWGEGSYAEPCAEYGFRMYETVRDVFCREPAGGWPQNYGPADVGLGPYDLAEPESVSRDSWDFADGAQRWSPMMGITDFGVADGVLRFRSASADPALTFSPGKLRAAGVSRLVVRMRVTPAPDADEGDSAQVFWQTTTASVSERTSVSAALPATGEFTDVVFDLAANPRWRGTVTAFRFDPTRRSGIRVEIAEARLLRQ